MSDYQCECGRPVNECYITAGNNLMVECPVHGLHEWGEVSSE